MTLRVSGMPKIITHGWLFAPEIASGAVRLVLRDYEPAPLSISAVHPAGRRLATKTLVFVDFLAGIFTAEPDLAMRGSTPIEIAS